VAAQVRGDQPEAEQELLGEALPPGAVAAQAVHNE
jgi:hypothetical protein